MIKKVTIKLYAMYVTKGKEENLRKDPNFLCMRGSREAECIQYFDISEIEDWIYDIHSQEFKYDFGIRMMSEDGTKEVQPPNREWFDKYIAVGHDPAKSKLIKMANIIKFALDEEVHYYEVPRDNVRITRMMTGHTHYCSQYETCWGCNNCDAANCDRCYNIYVVSNGDDRIYVGYDKYAAENAYKSARPDCSDIIIDIYNRYGGGYDEEKVKELIGSRRDRWALNRIMDRFNVYSCEV